MVEPDDGALLAPLRDAPTPTPGVGVGDGLRAGRRAVRVRRLFLAASMVVVAAMVVAVGPLLVRGLGPSRSVPPAGGGGDPFDPLRRVAVVGTAGGFVPTSYQTGRAWQRAVLRLPDRTGPAVTVTLYPPDAGLPVGDARRAGTVGGRAAYWLPPPMGGGSRLAWRLHSDVWAIAHVGRTGPDWRVRLRHIAEAVRPANAAARVPFTVSRRATAALGRFSGVYVATRATGDLLVAALVFRPADVDPRRLDGGADTFVGVQRDGVTGALLPRELPPDHRVETMKGHQLWVSDTWVMRLGGTDNLTAAALVGAPRRILPEGGLSPSPSARHTGGSGVTGPGGAVGSAGARATGSTPSPARSAAQTRGHDLAAAVLSIQLSNAPDDRGSWAASPLRD